MIIQHEDVSNKVRGTCRGVSIQLTGDEVATAIHAWLVAHGVHIEGPRTIRVNGELCEHGRIFVDPSGFVIDPRGDKFSGYTN
jgi:hypothetical protein